FRVIVPALLLALVTAGCGSSSWVDSELQIDDSSPAATVNGVEIPRRQVDTAVRDILQAAAGDLEEISADERASLIEPLQRQVLSTIIQGEVIKGIADARGVEIDTAEIDAEIERQIEQRGEEGFARTIASNDLSIALLRDVLMPAQYRVDQLTAQLLADEPDVDRRTVRHILVETEEEARLVIAELEDGADFAELAESRSIDTASGTAGGDLGPSPEGVFVEEFDEAVWSSDIGDLVGPVESQFGFHVLEVTGEESTPAVDLPGQQAQVLVGQELSGVIAAAFEEAEVTIAPGFGEWDPVTGTVLPFDAVGDGDDSGESGQG
ncbi:MAG: peptidylprolyl isomerase, partial [Nitriliruptoraceae bacterium]